MLYCGPAMFACINTFSQCNEVIYIVTYITDSDRPLLSESHPIRSPLSRLPFFATPMQVITHVLSSPRSLPDPALSRPS